MKFSMNGFRKQLSSDVTALRDIVRAVVDGDHYDKQDLIDAVNNIITHSNVVNCVYHKDDPDFSDISHIEVEHLEIEGFEQ
jgi:hypothetical protein